MNWFNVMCSHQTFNDYCLVGPAGFPPAPLSLQQSQAIGYSGMQPELYCLNFYGLYAVSLAGSLGSSSPWLLKSYSISFCGANWPGFHACQAYSGWKMARQGRQGSTWTHGSVCLGDRDSKGLPKDSTATNKRKLTSSRDTEAGVQAAPLHLAWLPLHHQICLTFTKSWSLSRNWSKLISSWEEKFSLKATKQTALKYPDPHGTQMQRSRQPPPTPP